jgi:Fe(3+) dicitrate transport protein
MNKNILSALILSFIGLSVFSQNQTIEDEDTSIVNLNTVIFSKKRVNTILDDVPGSATYINKNEIRRIAPISANDVFRKVAGVHVVDEEGAGMRINIGIRGLDPDRSRAVLVLEDGIPVSLNPYGEPEMYYSPVIDRMSGVEVLKGSGQILFGPQTIGGVVNYLTANPSEKPEFKFRFTGGEGGLFTTLLSYSTTVDKVGITTTLVRKHADKIGYAGFDIVDFTNKFVIQLSKKSSLNFKMAIYDEVSNSTYIGLTQTMYDAGNQDFALMAPNDVLRIRRYSGSVSHNYQFNSKFKLQTNVFGYTTTRDWQRQDFGSTKSTSNQTGVIWGDSSIAGGAVFMRNQNAHRDRQFEVIGLESKATYEYKLGNRQSELKFGARYIYERAFEQRKNGKKADAKSGDLVEDEIRTGKALSAFIHNQINLFPKLLFTVGARIESYDYNRNILRNTFRVNNVNRIVDTNLMANNQINTIIPGFGFNYNLSAKSTVFFGAHKGYAPPRVKDAITAQGQVYQLDAEESVNIELGTRGKVNDFLNYELTTFRMNFSNQIIPVSESSGGVGAGLVNGGNTIHEGIETAYRLNISNLLHTKTKILFQNSLTFVNAYFSKDRFVVSAGDTINVINNKTPYAPSYFHTGSLTFEFPIGIGFSANATLVGEQYGDVENLMIATNDGRSGLLPKYQVFDANVFYKFKKYDAIINFSVKNLTDERYITSRRPQGIRLGLPRFMMLSFEMTI